jgi:hypothetical protein
MSRDPIAPLPVSDFVRGLVDSYFSWSHQWLETVIAVSSTVIDTPLTA